MEIKTPEINEIKKPKLEAFIEIKPESGMTADKAREFWDNKFDNLENTVKLDDAESTAEFGPKYNDMEHMQKHIPPENSDKGHWEGEWGNSEFIPNDDTEAGLKAKEKLAEFGEKGVTYINCEPDFSKCAEATVEIDNMTENRAHNFMNADIKLAEKWNAEGKDGKSDWDRASVAEWRDKNNCVWHERCDTKTMDLISRDIHNTDAQIFSHSGGVSECKKRDAGIAGGGFDV